MKEPAIPVDLWLKAFNDKKLRKLMMGDDGLPIIFYKLS